MPAVPSQSSLWRRIAGKELLLLGGLFVICSCLWLFVGIAEEVGEGEHDHLEAAILRSFRRDSDQASLRGPVWLGDAVRDISALGGPALTILLGSLVAVYLLLNGRTSLAAILGATIGGGALLGSVLKHFFARVRPEVVPHLAPAVGSSFPSGHSLVSAVVYITIGVLLARGSKSGWNRVFFIVAGLLLSGLIGISRVMLGVHYPSDVLAGWMIGTAWAIFCWIAAVLLQGGDSSTD